MTFIATPMIVREHSSCVFVSVETRMIYEVSLHIDGSVLPCGHTVNTTVQCMCVSMSLILSGAGLSDYSMFIMFIYVCVCLSLQASFSVISSLLIWCGLSAGDLVESLWCLMLLARLRSRHSYTFTLLVANIPGLLHVFHPRHQHGEDTPHSPIICRVSVIIPLLDAKATHLIKNNYLLVLNGNLNYLL